ncbi:prothymosin alpha-B isoform X1 [Takifugu flavidus]|uniref:prothymosin alpha-B isoform X1 n=1 Tax=Takifugu flavidus TaxID=433684 RepID=UPI00254472EA|nr:prothymosin alpha-B isoform X1 [Takifugu flavidus]
MADTQVDSGSDISAKDLKEKKLLEEKENGKDAATNGKVWFPFASGSFVGQDHAHEMLSQDNDENGEPEIGDEEEEDVDEEEDDDDEDDGDGEEEDEDDDDDVEGGTKRAAEDEDDDDDEDVETKKQKTDDDD